MKRLSEFVSPTSVVALISRMTRKLKTLEGIVASQRRRLFNLGAKGIKEVPSTHTMEIEQDNRMEIDVQRRDAMSDPELRVDLEKKYGKTGWAKKLVNEIVSARADARDDNNLN